MKGLFKTILVGIFILSLNLSSLASDKIGTTAAAFLKIPCGARAIGMGGAFSTVADDVTSTYWNPAGLGQLTKKEASFTYLSYFQDMGFGYVAYVHPTTFGSFGGTISYLGHKKIEGYDVNAQPTENYLANDRTITLSYGRKINEKVSIGGNIKYLKEVIEKEQAFGFAADLGGLYKGKNFSTGLVIQNLGSKMKFIKEEDILPLNFKLGIAYKMFNDKLTLALDGNLPNDNDAYFNIGGECWILNPFACRIGYRSSQKDEYNSICGGVGLRGKDYNLDVAYESYGELGDTYYYSLTIRF